MNARIGSGIDFDIINRESSQNWLQTTLEGRSVQRYELPSAPMLITRLGTIFSKEIRDLLFKRSRRIDEIFQSLVDQQIHVSDFLKQ
jgi:hypothetical protein